jgi:hypothetical protein
MSYPQIKGQVDALVEKWMDWYFDNHNDYTAELIGTLSSRAHIKKIAISIIDTKFDLGPHGGSFVHNVVENRLIEAYRSADSINLGAIPFYVYMLSSISERDFRGL